MSSQASASGLEAAYHRLHPKIRRWIRDQGWDELREIQARTIVAVLESDRDVLIAASTMRTASAGESQVDSSRTELGRSPKLPMRIATAVRGWRSQNRLSSASVAILATP